MKKSYLVTIKATTNLGYFGFHTVKSEIIVEDCLDAQEAINKAWKNFSKKNDVKQENINSVFCRELTKVIKIN